MPLPGLTFLGHATVLIELGGLRILTDPILVDRLMFLTRVVRPGGPVPLCRDRPRPPEPPPSGPLRPPVAGPDDLGAGDRHRAGGRGLAAAGAGRVSGAGARRVARGRRVRITATPAEHPGFRPPFGPRGTAVGYLIESGQARLYFAGDTDLFPEMATMIPGELDVALLPIGGWGPRLGSGHLDPAARRRGRGAPRAAVRGAHPLGHALAVRPGPVSRPTGSRAPRRSSSAASMSGSARPVPDPDRPSRRAGTLRSLTNPPPVSR